MKLKRYSEFIKEEHSNDMVLYHGSPFNFTKFKNQHTFFTDSIKFAADYSDTKSFDTESDETTKIYTVKLHCDLFDINNEDDYNKLYEKLPSKIKYSYNNFGFQHEEDKDIYMLNMKGFSSIEPFDFIKDIKVGDTFPNPEYERETYKVSKIDDDYVYAYNSNSYEQQLSKSLTYYGSKSSELYEFIEDVIKKELNIRIVDKQEVHSMYDVFKYNNPKYFYPEFTPSEELKKKFKELNDVYESKMTEYMCIKKFVRYAKLLPIKDTWRFYENGKTDLLIKELGYGGYIALEEGHKTYCIFDQNKSVEIIDIK